MRLRQAAQVVAGAAARMDDLRLQQRPAAQSGNRRSRQGRPPIRAFP
jgi:hypothetical protein